MTPWPTRKPIAARPECSDREARAGDFEMDLIIGANWREIICSLGERKTGNACLIPLSHGKQAEPLARAVNAGLKKLAEKGRVLSSTTGNGPEFTKFRTIERGPASPCISPAPTAPQISCASSISTSSFASTSRKALASGRLRRGN